MFAVGEEVLAFHDFDDLVGQATRLLNEAGLTVRLGDAAARRGHRDHTYDLRVAAYGTVGEVAGTLRSVFGVYRPTAVF